MPTRWHRRVRSALTERLGYKVAALFFAFVLWVAASGEKPGTRYVTVRFDPAIDSAVQLVSPAPAVRALVAGPARELLKLYSNPPAVHRAFGPETPDAVTLDLRAADVELPDGVSHVTVRDVAPHVVELRFRARTATAARP